MKNDYKKSIISILKEIITEYPNITIAEHLTFALSEYNNFEGISDKEFLFILEKYKEERDLDIQIPHSTEEVFLNEDEFEDEEEFPLY